MSLAIEGEMNAPPEAVAIERSSTSKLYPLLKWAGGKEQELKYIIPNLPRNFINYYEPFVGGGAVYTAINADRYFINDKSEELISLYRSITNGDRKLFFTAIDQIITNWDRLTELLQQNAEFFIRHYTEFSAGVITEETLKSILNRFVESHEQDLYELFGGIFNYNSQHFIKEVRVNLMRKTKRMKQLEQIKHRLPDSDILDNIETAFKSAYYMHFRHIYNNTATYGISAAQSSAVFLFIRNFAYSGMFRYNAKGEFNVPYGGIGYNRKNFSKKIDYLRSNELRAHLEATTIENLDFEQFFALHEPEEGDFIFLDPPYDSEFSTYAQNEFTREDQKRLANYLINECRAKWMLIIKNTNFIYSLYSNGQLNIRTFDKTYLVSFMNRNDRNTEHLLITNY